MNVNVNVNSCSLFTDYSTVLYVADESATMDTGTESFIEIKDAGLKGKGAFASIDLAEGTYIGRYVGDLLTNEAMKARYPDRRQASYLFELTEELCIDAQESTHFSRFFNHAEHGNLEVRFDVDARTIKFFALRSISAGEELTFDYGPKYWLFRGQPTEDSRNVSSPDALADVAFEHEQAGRPLEAIAAYERACLEEPTDTSTAINFSILLKYRGELERAELVLRRAFTVRPSRIRTDAIRLLGGGLCGLGGDELARGRLYGTGPHESVEAAALLRRVLQSADYSAAAVRERLLAKGSAGGPPTGLDLLRLRHDEDLYDTLRSDVQGVLLLLFAIGVAIPTNEAERTLAEVEALLEHGLLVRLMPWDIVVATVQVYPLALELRSGEAGAQTGESPPGVEDLQPASEALEPSPSHPGMPSGDLFVVTDFEVESLLPARYAVMAVGIDSLNLAYLAPRRRCSRVLDVCCGSGVQSLVAARTYADAVVALDINPRAVRFCRLNAHLNGLETKLTVHESDVFDALPPAEARSAPSWAPFDVILANPPFVAVPPAPADADVNALWALYADGGADGAQVLRQLVRGASDSTLLRAGGLLAIVSEFPNIRNAHMWLVAQCLGAEGESSAKGAAVSALVSDRTLSLAVVFNPRHVQEAAEYAFERSEERGWPWASLPRWQAHLQAAGVTHMGLGMCFAVVRGDAPTPTCEAEVRCCAISCPLDGGVGSEDWSMLATARENVRAIIDGL